MALKQDEVVDRLLKTKDKLEHARKSQEQIEYALEEERRKLAKAMNDNEALEKLATYLLKNTDPNTPQVFHSYIEGKS